MLSMFIIILIIRIIKTTRFNSETWKKASLK